MESPVVRSRGRPRKRRREEMQNDENNKGDVMDFVENNSNGNGIQVNNVEIKGNPRKRGRPPKRRLVEIPGPIMVGRYVLKEFEGSGVFLGKIVSYDAGLYRVDYEDGDCEDLDSGELREYLIADERARFVGDLLERKKKLDGEVGKKSCTQLKGKLENEDVAKLAYDSEEGDAAKLMNKLGNGDIEGSLDDVPKVEVPTSCGPDGEVDGSEVDDDDDDSSSDSCEYGLGWETRSETETPAIPPPELPPSSGSVGVPDECVSHLFSVYGFLRSFSIRLFLSPFTLDDLVGCLNCTAPNTLLDAIHVALLRALKRYLEALDGDGSELASKCMRCIDWGLLDMLTWPVYLVHYLMVMGHLYGDEWKGFYIDALEKDYCTLSVVTKLRVLQVLCDVALDTPEIRAEIDLRLESEVGMDPDTCTAIPLESGPRKVHPRNRKTSGQKDRENLILDSDNSSTFSTSSLIVKDSDHNRGAANVDEDGNGDECLLCGMDGVLLCCDGCPSAYHPRCIGVNKLSIPEGEWFCPECTISRLGPTITIGTSLRGAEVFGVDPYAQLFLGTCNHLLVLKVSVKTSPFVRHYNRNDIPKVVRVLCSSQHQAVLYLGICQAILKYWELPHDVLPPLISQMSMASENRDTDVLLTNQLQAFGEDESKQVPNKVEFENYASSVGESFTYNVPGSSCEVFLKADSNDVLLGVALQTDLTSVPRGCGPAIRQNTTYMTSKMPDKFDLSCSSLQGLGCKSSMSGKTSGYKNSNISGWKNSISLPEDTCVHGKEDSNGTGGKRDQKWKDTCLYMGTIFKPHAYINHYVHGDFAASAAANFAVLSSEEKRASEAHASDPRKVISANVMLQVKGFSSAAVRFFWPSTEKKLIEVPRERCSWCLHCKAPITSKKACLLNQAALNATRSAMKFVSGLRLVKNVEGGLYGVAAYTLYMEESLRGLVLGPFQSMIYRQQWRKEVEQASTCIEMKSLLLKLEENLCAIALSSEWTKLVDNWMDESSVPQSACPIGSTQKRGPGRRRKHLATSEATVDDSVDSSRNVSWWCGRKIAKLVFQRGTLPHAVLRKAARQGGSRRIPGVYYAEGSDLPKRSRQFIWRAAIEMARTVSQLALQVRYLDHHVKWSDLLRPEQSGQEGKGPETEASAFRNAQICDKKVVENKIMYGVAFGHQKHLSPRLTKSIVEKEESEDGMVKYWFLETRVPLYLIKEYEENVEKTHIPPPKKPDTLSKLQRRQLKASRKDIFCYLARKRDNLYTCPCASCHQDVLLGVAVKCSTCEGYCHKGCTMSSTAMRSEDVEFITTCKQCSHSKAPPHNSSRVESPTSPLVMQGQEYQNSANVVKSTRLRSTSQHQNSATVSKSVTPRSTGRPLPSVSTSRSHSNRKLASCDSNSTAKKRLCHWGLIWKKKENDPDGSAFRLQHVLFRGGSHTNSLSPVCYLCQKPYNPHLMYIHCETCNFWYHADAVELDESKLSNLVGFKCCRCRRIKSPTCPYGGPNLKKTELKKLRIKGPKVEAMGANSLPGAISEQVESLPSTPISSMEEDLFIEVDDPLLLSVSKVEQIPEPKAEVDFEWNNVSQSGPAPQKLPVRRHIKNEKDDDGFTSNDPYLVQLPTSVETMNISNPPDELDVSNGGLENGTFDYENLNFENNDFEPQTYFSFTELLEADDGNQFGGVDASRGGAWENFPCENLENGLLQECEMVSSKGGCVAEASMEMAVDVECCNICSQTKPSPDLSCHNCGLLIHSHCSPWEELSQGDSWTCGSCRIWR